MENNSGKIGRTKDLQALFANNPLPMWIFDVNTLEFLEVNLAAINHYGYSREEFMRMTLKDIRPPEDLERLYNDLENANQIYKSASEIRHLKKNGTLIYVEITSHELLFKGRKARHALANDITEKRKIVQELAKSEERFRGLFENMSQGVIYLDATGSITLANPAALEILGLTQSQIEGRSSMDPRWKTVREDGSLFPGHGHPSTVALRTGRRVKNVIMGVYNPVKEEQRWIEIDASPIFKDGSEKPAGVYTIFDDVTEKRATGIAIRKSESLFKSIFNSAFSASVLLTPEGKVIEVNDTACKWFNAHVSAIKGEQICELDWWKTDHYDYRDQIKEAVLKARKGEPFRDEIKMTNSGGSDIHVDLSLTPLLYESGQISWILLEGHDTTQLRKQQEYSDILSQMIAKSTSGMAIADARKHDLPLIYVNEAFSEITGYTREEVIGKNCRFLQGSRRDQPELEIVREAIKNRQECRVELMNFRKNGELFWNRLYLAPVISHGELTHYAGVQTDITDWKKEQQELEAANNELRKLDENKSEFLSLISHEINTPLNGIIGFSYILRESINSPELFELVDMLSESARRLYEFTRQGLYITDLRTRPERFRKKMTSIGQSIEKALLRIENEITKKNIKILKHLGTEADQVMGNDELLELAFSGILNNSVFHSQENSAIEIKTGNDQNYVKIQISDQGEGFSETAMKKLFSPFSPGVKNMDKRKGLGLYLVKLVTEFHGGEVMAWNLRDKGAAVNLRIPLANVPDTNEGE